MYDFAPYSREELGQIVRLLAKQQGLAMDIDAAELLADYCGESPGDARVMVKRLQDFVSTGATDHVTINVMQEALASFGYLDKTSKSVDLAQKLRKMEALEFEEFVADLFRKKGYAVEITQGSGDHGIDLLMRKDNQLIAVQCKRWNTPVGEPVVRDFLGSLMGIGAKVGYVIAASTFTSKALSFVQDKPIKLIDLDALIDLVTQGSKDIDY